MLPFSRLLAVLALVYPGLVLYGSLFPLVGWTHTGVEPLAFLSVTLPRYWTLFDLLSNVALYLPLGFVWTLWLRQPTRAQVNASSALLSPREALQLTQVEVPGQTSPRVSLGLSSKSDFFHLQKIWWIATLVAAGMSFGVELAQNWLPTRVASSLDLASNTAGAALGSLLARGFGDRWLDLLRSWSAKWFDLKASGQLGTELGLLLLALWFVGQWVPDGPVFVAGNWQLLGITGGDDWLPRLSEEGLVQLEAFGVGAYLFSIGLMLRELLRCHRWNGLALASAFFLSAASGRAISVALMVRPAAAFDWLTVGAQIGLMWGALALVLGFLLSDRWRRFFAVTGLVLGTLAINFHSPNPYGVSALPPGASGAFHNFAGLTRLIAGLWPLAALYWWAMRWRARL